MTKTKKIINFQVECFLGGLLRHHPQETDLNLQWTRNGAVDFGSAQCGHWGPQGQYGIPQVPKHIPAGNLWLFLVTTKILLKISALDSMVLASSALLWPGWPCQVSAICHWNVKGSPARLRRPWGHEWSAKVPDPQGWPIYWQAAICPHLVRYYYFLCIFMIANVVCLQLQSTRFARVRDIWQVEVIPSESHPRMLGRFWICLDWLLYINEWKGIAAADELMIIVHA